MNPIATPITGENSNLIESQDIRPEIIETLNDFYLAFNQRDLTLMQKNWLNDSTISMSNPLGGIKRGWDEIKEVYERIFLGNANVYVEFYDFTVINLENGFCAVGRERGYIELSGKRMDLAIRTSRIYQFVTNRYLQIHHHGSIENPLLLSEYQELIKKGQ